jgi:hypothetical protein
MDYRGSHFDEASKKPSHSELTSYAESQDGINWIKPQLGIAYIMGSAANYVILAGEATHNFTPFVDGNPACLSDARHKGLAGNRNGLKA